MLSEQYMVNLYQGRIEFQEGMAHFACPISNSPSVGGAVLKTALILTDSIIQSVILFLSVFNIS